MTKDVPGLSSSGDTFHRSTSSPASQGDTSPPARRAGRLSLPARTRAAGLCMGCPAALALGLAFAFAFGGMPTTGVGPLSDPHGRS